MEIEVLGGTLAGCRDDGVVLFAAKGEEIASRAAAVGGSYRAAVATLGKRRLFDGSSGQSHTVVGGRGTRVPAVTLVGLGEARRIDLEALRRAAAVGVRAARDQGAARVTVALPRGRGRDLAPARAARAVLEGALLGLYRFETYRTEKSKSALTHLTLLVPRSALAAARRGAADGRILAESTCFTRDLGNEPGNVATPTWVADRALTMAREEGLKSRVLGPEEMERLGMGALLGVARGSSQPPRLVVLTWEPKTRRRLETVALVGKGITFDSGGISIKPAAKMEDMKFDMCGGGAVFGALRAAARLNLPLRVHGLVPLAENLPDGNAYKPGDVLKASNGVTIEVKNTDAEGRLVLADALAYAVNHLRPRPRVIVDVATLTGSAGAALGDQFAALLANDERLAARLLAAAEESGDPLWRMPLNDGYRKQIESTVADVSNLGTPGAGVQTGAAFLEKFVGKLAWAHLDIASVAWTERDTGMFKKGATGFGVRLLVEALRARGRW